MHIHSTLIQSSNSYDTLSRYAGPIEIHSSFSTFTRKEKCYARRQVLAWIEERQSSIPSADRKYHFVP